MTKPTAIFVLGMHRSGTSALAGALAASGVWLGEDLLEPAKGVNDKGFWEHKELVAINEDLLERAGLCWFSPLSSDSISESLADPSYDLEPLKDRARAFIGELMKGVADSETPCVAIKDPRLCLTASFWLPLFEEAGARVVGLQMVRHPSEVARSLEKRDGIVSSHSNVLWLDHVLSSMEFCRQLEISFTGSYDDLMESPRGYTELALKSLGIGLRSDKARMEQWIQGDLRHHKGETRYAPGLLGDEVALLYSDIVRRHAIDPLSLAKLVNRFRVVFDDIEVLFGRFNASTIQLQKVSAHLESLGRDHSRALEVIKRRDQQLEALNAERERVGGLHREAIETISARDREIEGLNLEINRRSNEFDELRTHHEYALSIVEKRDQQLSRVQARVTAFEASFPGKLYRAMRLLGRIAKKSGSHPVTSGAGPASGRTVFPGGAERPPVDVIIPVYGGFEETREAIVSAAGSIDTAWARLVVINDCSPEPEITDWLRKSQAEYGYELLENERNLGFVGTVNKGMTLRREADVLLLNSDVEVANDWLERLQDCAYSRENVASVTATANNATICSFPVFCEDNDLPAGFDVGSLDAVFRKAVPANMAVEIPSGVGCCMYMRRACMDEIGLFDETAYGRGYGEENDWCQSAIKSGWHNLHALNVFVYHKGAVSFAEESNPRKEENLRTLLKRFPSYNADVQDFISRDPARLYRVAVSVAMLGESRLPKVLLLAHGMGGGVYTHLRELIREHPGIHYLLIEPVTGGGIRLHLAPEKFQMYLDFNMDEGYPQLLDLLRASGVGHVHVHHTMGLPTRLWGLARDLETTLDYTLHDYAVINGNPSLLDSNGRFVGDLQDRDQLCAARCPLPPGVDAKQWRENQLFLLEQARYLICPSDDMYRRLRSVSEFSHLTSWVVTHHMDARGLQSVRVKACEPQGQLRVLVLGALSPEKGADILEGVARATAKLDLDFHLLGYAYRALDRKIKVHGSYAEEDAIELISNIAPHVVWFPVRCAETYSYTLSLALQLGLPVVASKIGAFPERLAGRGATVLFSEYDSEEAWIKFWKSASSDFNVILSSSVSESYAAFSDDDFYGTRYIDGLRCRKGGGALSPTVLSLHVENAEAADAVIGRREKILRLLLYLTRTKIGGGAARLVPLSIQRGIKRKLTRNSLH
ncbi:glycosyltransferase [Marinobacter sp. NFXS9]|uniref:glycosyltransferase n=1 Tax=Marinobacter sp. NFXS9 TaxID=2818433 RepID=UPI0032DF1082